jgi:GT2 family glycosyltransferase
LSDHREPIPTLIVPTLNGHKRLGKMIDSIDYPVNELLIIDNGASRGATWDLMHIYDNPNVYKTHTISLPNNLGVAASWNLGIKLTPWSEYWLIVNDDVTFEPGALDVLVAASGANTLAFCDSPQPWSAFTIGEGVVDAVGLFDEIFYPAYFEDTDYERRVQAYEGSGVIVRTSARIQHRNSSTIGNDPALMAANVKTYSNNSDSFNCKAVMNDFGIVGWKLSRRRENEWRTPNGPR